jgi:uncharacterized protein (TIGR01777 family)
MKRVVIAGATGFIGRQLCRQLRGDYELIALSRNVAKATIILDGLAQVVQGGAKRVSDWTETIDGAFAVINLSGENIGSGRWTSGKKEKILSSRLDSLKALLEAIKRAKEKPKVAVIASAIGFYGSRDDEQIDEDSAAGKGFLADVCKQIENIAGQIEAAGVRCVIIRSGVVLGRQGGALLKLMQPFRFFMGGHIGTGQQWFSWISLEDEVNAIKFLMENDNLHGAFNLTAPEPVRMKEFCNTLGNCLNRPSWFHVPGLVLKIIFGEMADEMLLASQKVYPKRLLQAGFKFKYPDLENALKNIPCQLARENLSV